MKISIFPPFSVHEIGQRSNNEDNIFPIKGAANGSDSLFVVCDGVGGGEKGEVASELACKTLAAFFAEKGDFVSTETEIQAAVLQVQKKMEKYADAYGASAKGMACTMTLLHLHAAGATIAHIGDSRVYHVREGKILFQTHDHKLVNDLVKYGAITPEQALTHPQRNVITRALQAHSIQEAEADVHIIQEVQAGDYFFLCTDGILERVTDAILCEILTKKQTDEAKMQAIYIACQGYSKDNFSAYLVQIKEVSGTIPDSYKTKDTESLLIPTENNTSEQQVTSPPKPLPKWLMPLAIFGIISLVIALWAAFLGGKEPAAVLKKDTIPVQTKMIDTLKIVKDSIKKDSILPKIPSKNKDSQEKKDSF